MRPPHHEVASASRDSLASTDSFHSAVSSVPVAGLTLGANLSASARPRPPQRPPPPPPPPPPQFPSPPPPLAPPFYSSPPSSAQLQAQSPSSLATSPSAVSSPAPPPPFPSPTSLSAKQSSLSRWLFARASNSTPPTSPPHATAKRPRSKPDRRGRSQVAPGTDHIRRAPPLPPSQSERSSRSSVEDHRRQTRTPDLESAPSLRLIPPRMPPLARNPSSLSSSMNNLSTHKSSVHTASISGASMDDWGLGELPDDEPVQPGPRTHPAQVAHCTSRHASRANSDGNLPSLHSDDVTFASVSRDSTDSLRTSFRDTLTLRAFDENLQRRSSAAPELAAANQVIGVYADPTAEADDWADDFVLDDASLGQESSLSLGADQLSPRLHAWFDDAVKAPSEMAESLQQTAAGVSHGPKPVQTAAAVEISPTPDDSLPVRQVPATAFTTPKLTHSSLLMYPGVGYQASAAHPSCAKVKDLFLAHGATIRKHFDALVRDSGGTIAFDHSVKSELLLSLDSDVVALAKPNADLAVDVLLWKLEWAALKRDNVDRARVLLALSKLHKDGGKLEMAIFCAKDALAMLEPHPTSPLSVATAIELEFECANLHRAAGAMAEAGRSLMRAMTHSATLAQLESVPGGLSAVKQRALWWQLRCKNLRAELAFDLEDLGAAAQYYCEYIVESVSRMTGMTAPPPVQESTGSELMRYCLFSPRRLVLALWTTVICLGEMRCFPAATDTASLTSLVASAFGYEDVNEAAAEVKTRVKDIGAELRAQYDEISKTILQSGVSEAEELHSSSTPTLSGIPSTPFDYNMGDFGDDGDIVEEDWDTQLERELNVKIQRCCDGDANQQALEDSTNALLPDITLDIVENSTGLSNEAGQGDLTFELRDNSREEHSQGGHEGSSHLGSDNQGGQLIEAELRQYLNRVAGASSNFSSRRMYPKPTQPFEGPLMGPKDHETFLRMFVRSKDPEIARRVQRGLPSTAIWQPSAYCKLNYNIDPIEDIHTFNFGAELVSPGWSLKLLEAVWKVVRSQVDISRKSSRLRSLIKTNFTKVANQFKNKPSQSQSKRDRRRRLDIIANLLDSLRLSREVLYTENVDSKWFPEACTDLGQAAATVTPAAKAAVELFQAECRAHFGVKAFVPSEILERCISAARERTKQKHDGFRGTTEDGPNSFRNHIPVVYQQTVVDVMHALYWRTKSGFDESSEANSLERLLHAEVASTLFLTGSSVSPVDGSSIVPESETSILHIPKKRKTKSVDSDTLVDETRRVGSTELIQELQAQWNKLPRSAGIVRAKIAFALAHHARVTQGNYFSSERYLFDGLLALHAVGETSSLPNGFFSPMQRVSPVAIVSSPLAGAILSTYGRLTIKHSKYRYGIASLEAASDGIRVRSKDRKLYRAFVFDLVESALQNGDWRRAAVLLFDLRAFVHPMEGLRNEFLHICVKLHTVCRDNGCFGASIVPLRAFSALIYEERLRVLLQRFRRRLAKKGRSRFRHYISGAPLPKFLPGTPLFSQRKNALASFFEVPVVQSALDGTLRQSAALLEARTRSSTVDVPPATRAAKGGALHRLFSLLWPLQMALFHSPKQNEESEHASSVKGDSVRADRSEDLLTQTFERRENDAALETLSRTTAPPAENEHEEEQRELLRIEAEQEVTADSDRCRVELLRVETDYSMGKFVEADSRCLGLLDMDIPPFSRYRVYEIMARIRLKRREITQCLELIDKMERAYIEAQTDISNAGHQKEPHRKSFFRSDDSDESSKDGEKPPLFVPQVTFLRLRTLIHGGRLGDALGLADKALELCDESAFWDQGRFHFLRGKVLFAMATTTAPYFRAEADTSGGISEDEVNLAIKLTEFTMSAFETASQYFDAAGDELSTAKSDLMWARTCIDILFRRVVPAADAGGGMPLKQACELSQRRIVIPDVQEVLYGVLSLASFANLPILLIDALAALAEINCIRKQPSNSWSFWVSEAWKFFSRLFADADDFSVVLSDLAPVSTLVRLQNLCGRLVRLVMCNEHIVSVSDMNQHLRLFEAYVSLHLTIERKMNLSTSQKDPQEEASEPNDVGSDSEVFEDEVSIAESDATKHPRSSRRRKAPLMGREASTSEPGHEQYVGPPRSEKQSDGASEVSFHTRPAGAFLHMLGNEGVALGRHGLTLINRPRKQVISAVKGTGAVLIPSNFFSNSKTTPGFSSHELGKDAEMIFPFKPNLGLGAMHIFDGEGTDNIQALNPPDRGFPLVDPVRGGGDAPHFALGGMASPDSMLSAGSRSLASNEQSGGARENGGMSAAVTPKQSPLPTHSSRLSNSLPVESQRRTSSMSRHSIGRSRQSSQSKLFARASTHNELRALINAMHEELGNGSARTTGSADVFGRTTAERVWAHWHRIKTESRRYSHGDINLEQLHERNSEAIMSWAQCIPLSGKEWTVPESIGRRLVYILYAHGVIGYYAVERGGSVERIVFGGKQDMLNAIAGSQAGSRKSATKEKNGLRPPTDLERKYLYDMVKGFKRDGVWYKNRDSEIVNGMANHVLKAPKLILSAASPVLKSRSRPIVLITDLVLQILPWELFFDHVVIRSHCLLDVIRGAQQELGVSLANVFGPEDPAIAAARRIVRFINFGPSRKEILDLERTDEARRQQLAFRVLLRLNHMTASRLVSVLDLGGFSDPGAVGAMARPTGPLASPLSQSRKAVQLLGVRVPANIGRRNYPNLDFLRVAGLGSATTEDLKEAAMVPLPGASDKEELKRDLGAYIPVFMFSYADLVDRSDSVFGLREEVPNGMLMFTPAIHMKVLARHLEDEELYVELGRASGRANNRIVPDVIASVRVLVEYVSRFSREKRIPIVIFLGQGLMEVFPRRRSEQDGAERRAKPAAERFVQLSGGGRKEYFRWNEKTGS